MTSSSKNALMVFTGSGVKSVRSDDKIEWPCLAKFLNTTIVLSERKKELNLWYNKSYCILCFGVNERLISLMKHYPMRLSSLHLQKQDFTIINILK